VRIILFTHPSFLKSQSMPRFAAMLANGMKARGHSVEVWTPEAFFYKLPLPGALKKWMGYIDQYIVFPIQVGGRLALGTADTLFVFTDQALGPWVPLVAQRPHVIHCHDFLAQRSALGQIPENPTSSTGKKYQEYIRKGYKQGRNFISVSNKTQQDLHQLLGYVPSVSHVVYNGLNQDFHRGDVISAREYIKQESGINTINGYLLHVGGNQWYKNRSGVVQMYNAWRSTSTTSLPLLMVGSVPTPHLMSVIEQSPYHKDIHVLSGKNDAFVRQAYGGASVFLFPSLAEGFGWPIAEAMASGCPVITTNEAPMTEVGGTAAFYINRKIYNGNDEEWAKMAALKIEEVLSLSNNERIQAIEAGITNANRFDVNKAIDEIEKIYYELL
jgi:glycosyltransferase involved in cell wall biosynthesis